MKHLTIYEAFESNILTQLMKFLEKKVNKLSLDKFKKDIFSMQEKFDIPTSKIQDKDIVYLKRDKALKLRSNKPVENPHDIYCLKFWFSVRDGYLGLSFTGNNVEDSLFFNENELDYIKYDLGYKTGELIPITDYSLLKHGDIVFLLIDSGLPLLARIYITEKNIYAIQDKYHGSGPSNDDSWNEWGLYSWCLKQSPKILTDHSKIHLYVKNDEPLQVVEKDVEVSPALYNLPTDSNFIPQDSTSSFQDEVLNKADFAIAILLENIITNKDLKKVSTIKKEREEQKKGAVKLLTDKEIKNINLQKRLKI